MNKFSDRTYVIVVAGFVILVALVTWMWPSSTSDNHNPAPVVPTPIATRTPMPGIVTPTVPTRGPVTTPKATSCTITDVATHKVVTLGIGDRAVVGDQVETCTAQGMK